MRETMRARARGRQGEWGISKTFSTFSRMRRGNHFAKAWFSIQYYSSIIDCVAVLQALSPRFPKPVMLCTVPFLSRMLS